MLKANSLFFFFEKLQLQFQKDFIVNATGLDLIIIGIGVGKGREWYTVQEIVWIANLEIMSCFFWL